jgi:hypothetical protein
MNHEQIAAGVYQRCNHFDPYLPPLSADLARAWGSLFAKHRLNQDDLLAAVDTVYETHGNGYRPMPADIITAAKTLRQDRFQRQPLDDIEAHNDRLVPLVAELAEAAAIPNETRTVFSTVHAHSNATVWGPTPRSPLMVRCPWCHASAGQRCFIPGTRQLFRGYHPARHDAAQATAPAPTATPLCSVCGAHALQAIHETARGICDGCWPSTNGHQQRNDERGTGS